MKRGSLLLLASLAAGFIPVSAEEVQRHGLVFEQWVRDSFFAGYQPASYTQRWDIPATANKAHGGLPVNPKAIKYGAAVDLGDALRQFEIDEPFLLIIGFWRQDGDTKRIVNIVASEISPSVWRQLWAPVTRADLLRLDTLIKDRSRPPEKIRRLVLQMKNAAPFTLAVMQLNPKIDAKGQRRLQCSLRFGDFFKRLAPEADRAPQANPTLFGVAYPGPISSKPRMLSPP